MHTELCVRTFIHLPSLIMICCTGAVSATRVYSDFYDESELGY